MFITSRLHWLAQSHNGYLFDGEGDLGAPTGSGTPIPTAPPAPAITGAPAAAPAIPSAPAISPTTDDRSTWVPPYRLRETRESAIREANTQFAAREAEIRAEAERYRQQVLALTGVQPPQNPETDAIKQQFFQLFPWAKKLEERFGDFENLVDRADDIDSQNSHYWQSFGRQTMDRVFDKASQSLGAPLSEDGKRLLHTAFTGFVSQSPEMTARYANDPTIVDDFLKAFTSNFIDPARRAATANVAARATGINLPQDTPGGAPRASLAPKPADLDERVNQAWAHYQTIAKP